MPTSRAFIKGIAVNGKKIYAIGGSSDGLNTLNTVEEYDPLTDTWSTKTSMPTARRYYALAELNGKIYVIGGLLNDNSTITDVVEEYDPVTDTWETKTNMPTKRTEGVAESIDGKIYVTGGYESGISNTTYQYNPITNVWTRKANMPTARRVLESAKVNNKMYVIGGSNLNPVLDAVEEYDPATDTWSTKASMPTARYALGSVSMDNNIYAIGGRDSNDSLTILEVFNPLGSVTPNAPLNLTATPNIDSITLSWDSVSDADSYTILRSTTSGTIDTVIATNVKDTTYIDTNVTPGVTYYYVVLAVKNGVESADSNVASAMIEETNNRALLLIKLLDENDKEYDLPMSDVDTFMSWYFDRGAGQGPAYYTFTKDYNAGPYISRKDYITYDKIICIEVNEYIK